jgi:hypothetical protein
MILNQCDFEALAQYQYNLLLNTFQNEPDQKKFVTDVIRVTKPSIREADVTKIVDSAKWVYIRRVNNSAGEFSAWMLVLHFALICSYEYGNFLNGMVDYFEIRIPYYDLNEYASDVYYFHTLQKLSDSLRLATRQYQNSWDKTKRLETELHTAEQNLQSHIASKSVS